MNIDFAVGLHIMGFLASHEGEPITSATMATSFGTSPVVLRRILTRLNQSGLVATKRGVSGGSVLARAAKSITLRQVYEAVCTKPEIFARHPKGTGIISEILGDYINEFYLEAEQSMLSHLAATSVADMDSKVRPLIVTALRCSR